MKHDNPVINSLLPDAWRRRSNAHSIPIASRPRQNDTFNGVEVKQQVGSLLNALNAGSSSVVGSISGQSAQNHYYRWAYLAGVAIGNAIMCAEYSVQELVGGMWADAPDSPLARLMRKPNEWITSSMMFAYVGLDFTFLGESYWGIGLNPAGEPVSLTPLVGKITAVIDKQTGIITGYKQTVNNGTTFKNVTHPAAEVVAFKLPRLQNILSGYGPMMAAGGSIKVDDEILKSRWVAFKQGLFPSAMVKFSERDPAKRKQFMDEFNGAYGGMNNANIGISPDVDVTITGRTPSEMDYKDSANQIRNEIMSMAQVPSIVAGITTDAQNRATAEAAEYSFARWNIRPKMKLISEQLDIDLVMPYFPGFRIKFASVVPADRDAQRKDDEMALTKGAITINEWRESKGRGPVDWGDTPLLPLSIMPLGSEPTPDPNATQAQSVTMAESLEQSAHGFSRESRRLIMTQRAKYEAGFTRSYTKTWRRIFSTIEKQFMDDVDKFQEGPNAQRLPDYTKLAAADAADKLLDPADLSELMYDETRSDISRGILLGGNFDGEVVGLGKDAMAAWNTDADSYRSAVARYSPEYYNGVATETQRLIVDTMAKSIADQSTWAEMRANIVNTFGAMKKARATSIAVTETTRVMNTGSHAFRVELKIKKKQWLASFVNTRDSHAEMDGTVIPNSQSFLVGADTMLYPGGGSSAEENVNCNCIAISVV